jgi:hypothetical protein
MLSLGNERKTRKKGWRRTFSDSFFAFSSSPCLLSALCFSSGMSSLLSFFAFSSFGCSLNSSVLFASYAARCERTSSILLLDLEL